MNDEPCKCESGPAVSDLVERDFARECIEKGYGLDMAWARARLIKHRYPCDRHDELEWADRRIPSLRN